MIRRQKSIGTFIKRNRSYIRLPLEHDVAFSFHPETSLDRLFKSLGISLELEVGDHEFDHKVYVGSNSVELVKALSQNESVKESIRFLFKDLALHIKADAGVVEAKFYGERRDLDKSIESMKSLAGWVNSFSVKQVPKIRDPHFIKLLAVEFWITGFAFYGFISLVEYIFSYRFIIDIGPIYTWMLIFLLLSLLIGIPVLLSTLRRSARSHKVLLENGLYLLLGFPLASFFLANDLNRALDKSIRETYSVAVTGRRASMTRVRRTYFRSTLGPYSYISGYKLKIDLTDLYGKQTERWISVKYRDYDSGVADLMVGHGYFGARHVEKIQFN